jgi:hypothetical protein
VTDHSTTRKAAGSRLYLDSRFLPTRHRGTTSAIFFRREPQSQPTTALLTCLGQSLKLVSRFLILKAG